MRNKLGWVSLALLMLAGCGTANFQTPATSSAPGIAGAPVYVYSMLDVRQDDFGRDMVAAVNRRILARLSEHGVTAEVVGFRETPTGMSASLVGSAYLPMERIVRDNCEAEHRLGARYRLFVVPSNMTILEAGQQYEVNWHLIDVTTNAPVWRSTLRGHRVVWWSHNEDAEGRATEFVDGVIEEMSRSGLFAPASVASATSAAEIPACAPAPTTSPPAPVVK